MTDDISYIPEESFTRSTESEEDYTRVEEVKGRTFYINFGLLRFGTRDPIQGASFFLTIVLLFVLVLIVIAGFIMEGGIDETLLDWITSPLLLTIGVAIGRSGSS